MNNPHRHKKLRETPEMVMLLWDYSKRLEERTDTFLANVMRLKAEFNRKTLDDKKGLAEKMRILVKKRGEENYEKQS
jgi:hypothetical protein